MNKLAFILTALIFLNSCSSPERKAQKAIKEYLKFTLNDFKSYEPVSYGKIDYAFSSYEVSPEYRKSLDKVVIWDSISEDFASQSIKAREKVEIYHYPDYYLDKSHEYYGLAVKASDSADFYKVEMAKAKNSYEPTIIGWKMKHTFRARIPAGGYKLNDYIFYFDKEFSKVTKSIDLSEE